jgi:hypothetical protein
MCKVPNYPKQVNMNIPLISLGNVNTVNSQFIEIRYYTNKYYTKAYIKMKHRDSAHTLVIYIIYLK